jgi:hypothetical protein
MCGYITLITVGGDVSRCLGGIRFSGQSLRLEPLAVVVKGLLLCCIFCLFRLSWFERPAGFKHSAANGGSLKHSDSPFFDARSHTTVRRISVEGEPSIAHMLSHDTSAGLSGL